MGVSILQLVVVIALQAVIASIFMQHIDVTTNSVDSGSGKSIVVYLFIFCFSQIFQLVLAVNAVRDPTFEPVNT